MIKNFNFYDIYGYLIPGFVLMFLFWLPFGLTTGIWPAQEWSSALLILVLGYVTGHLIHSFSQSALLERFRVGGSRELRYPTEILLDKPTCGIPSEYTLSEEFKELLCRRISERFKITAIYNSDVGAQVNGVASLLCRSALLQHGAASYAEQAQGMYVLLRGLAAAFVAGAAYHVGWAMARIVPANRIVVGLIALTLLAVLVFSFRERQDASGERQPLGAISVLLFLLLVGVVTGQGKTSEGVVSIAAQDSKAAEAYSIRLHDGLVQLVPSKEDAGPSRHKNNGRPFWIWSCLLATLEVILCVRLIAGFKRFAFVFAKSVYRDFVALESYPLGRSKGSGDRDEDDED